MSLVILAVLFVGTGLLHLTKPAPFRQIMPPAIPKPNLVIALSGAAEILGGVGILIPAVRPVARWGIFALLVAVFPANIYMAVDHVEPMSLQIPAVLLWARLPMQALLMWWVIAATAQQPSGSAATGSRTCRS